MILGVGKERSNVMGVRLSNAWLGFFGSRCRASVWLFACLCISHIVRDDARSVGLGEGRCGRPLRL